MDRIGSKDHFLKQIWVLSNKQIVHKIQIRQKQLKKKNVISKMKTAEKNWQQPEFYNVQICHLS